MSNITFSTCFYVLKSKFNVEIYTQWMNNFFTIVNNFNLVVYTDENSKKYINPNNNPKIKIIIKPIEKFYNYKYKDFWINNHENNDMLKELIDWRVNALWSEKIWFVLDTIKNKYFDKTDLYGWCDIGYFRNRKDSPFKDTPIEELKNWANSDKLYKLDKNKIHYACVANNNDYINFLHKIINKKNLLGLPFDPIPLDQTSIAGGFFIGTEEKIKWWSNVYEKKLLLYFKNHMIVKDDQIIIVDCVMSDLDQFGLHRENIPDFDNWFMFQRKLI